MASSSSFQRLSNYTVTRPLIILISLLFHRLSLPRHTDTLYTNTARLQICSIRSPLRRRRPTSYNWSDWKLWLAARRCISRHSQHLFTWPAKYHLHGTRLSNNHFLWSYGRRSVSVSVEGFVQKREWETVCYLRFYWNLYCVYPTVV